MNRLRIARQLVTLAKLICGFKFSKSKYGAWITDKGRVVYVQQFMHGEYALQEFGKHLDLTGDWKKDEAAAEDMAYDNGWIRVVNGPRNELMFVLGRKTTKKAKDRLEDIIFFNDYKCFRAESDTGARRIHTCNVDEAVEFVSRMYA